jgi:GcrA cell cycle regulator
VIPYLVGAETTTHYTVGRVIESVWTPERVEQLGSLWNEGLSTAEIGRRLGLTKNAVVGKAHRLCLPPRPSPLKFRPIAERDEPKPVIVEFQGPACSWPFGHPGEKGFHFCGVRPLPGKPYCAEHAALAYVKPKDRNTAAA